MEEFATESLGFPVQQKGRIGRQLYLLIFDEIGSSGRTRTYNPSVNSRVLVDVGEEQGLRARGRLKMLLAHGRPASTITTSEYYRNVGQCPAIPQTSAPRTLCRAFAENDPSAMTPQVREYTGRRAPSPRTPLPHHPGLGFCVQKHSVDPH
jgi:hypothetical protein